MNKEKINKRLFYSVSFLLCVILIGVMWHINSSIKASVIENIPLIDRESKNADLDWLMLITLISFAVFLMLFITWLYQQILSRQGGWSTVKFVLMASAASFFLLQGALVMNFISLNNDYGASDKPIKTTQECNRGPCLIDSFDYNNISSENDVLSEYMLFTYDQLTIWKDISSDPGLYPEDPIAVITNQVKGKNPDYGDKNNPFLKITCSQDAIRTIDWFNKPEKKIFGEVYLTYNPLIREVKSKCNWESVGLYPYKYNTYEPK